MGCVGNMSHGSRLAIIWAPISGDDVFMMSPKNVLSLCKFKCRNPATSILLEKPDILTIYGFERKTVSSSLTLAC